MKTLIMALAVSSASFAQAQVSCILETSGYVNGAPTLTSKPLKVFADSAAVTELFIKDGDFFAEYTRIPEMGLEKFSITYKTATNLHVETNVHFDKNGVATLWLAGDFKSRASAKLSCKKN